MNGLDNIDLAALKIVRYPDPRLRGPCLKVEGIDDALRALTRRMFELMYVARGVGLAAPQVGLPLRLFVANPAGGPDPDQEAVYISPVVEEQSGQMIEDEGCLSLPGLNCKIKRANVVTLTATDLDGQRFRQTGEELIARIFQHETDHLNGLLIADKMSAVSKMANRRLLKELEERFEAEALP